jgi:hypothetical protein
MLDLKCPECNCPAPPEASKCPNCGHKYDALNTHTASRKNGNGITVGRIGYAIKCEYHGKIHITANVATAPTRCPFC